MYRHRFFFTRVHIPELLIFAQLSFRCLFPNYQMLWSGYVFSLMFADTDIQINFSSNKIDSKYLT